MALFCGSTIRRKGKMKVVDWKTILYDKRHAIAISLLMLIAFTIRAWGVEHGFPLLSEKDEGQVVPAAVRFGSGDFNPHSFTYPSFFKYMLFLSYGIFFVVGRIFGVFDSTLAFKLHYFSNTSDFYLIGRLLSSLCGVISVWAIYLMAKRLGGKKLALVAASFAALEPYNIFYSQSAKPDMMMVALLMLSLYFSIRIFQDGKVRDYVWAGFFGGLAISSKYNALFCSAAITFSHLARILRSGNWRSLRIGFHWLALSGFLVIAFFFVGSPYALIEPDLFLRDLKFVQLVVGRSDAGSNYLATFIFYIKDIFLPTSLLSGLTGVLSLAGVVYSVFRLRRTRAYWGLLAFTLIHFFYFTSKASATLLKPHYLLPILPVTSLFAGLFVVEMEKMTSWSRKKGNLIFLIVVFLICCVPFYRAVRFNYKRSQTTTGNFARNWTDKNLPQAAKILQIGMYDLALNETEESIRKNNKDNPKERIELKITAAKKHQGKTFYAGFLNPGWNVTKETIETLDEMPLGVELPGKEMKRLAYWKNLDYQYAAVMVKDYTDGYFPALVDPQFYEIVDELEKKGRLLKEFIPNPPELPGWWIRFYEIIK